MNKLGAYYKSWETKWVSKSNEMDIANEEADIVYISFCNPQTNYKNPGNWSQTGIQFSQEWNVVVEAIDILKSKGKTVMLSVGGASYPFINTQYDNITKLARDLHCDGIDVDWEPVHDSKTPIEKDYEFSDILEGFYNADPTLLLSAAVFSTGAYPPTEGDIYKGLNIKGLKKSGNRLDWINIMAYDAGASYDPIAAYSAYKKIFFGKVYVGVLIGKHGWGDGNLTMDSLASITTTVKPSGDGVFIWGSKKTQGTPVTFNQVVDYVKNAFKKREADPVPDTPNKTPSLSGFVKVNGMELSLDGRKFVACGFNAYWMGITEEYQYPEKHTVKQMFEAAVKMGATTIRSHTLGGSSGNHNSLWFNNQINQNAWEAIDYGLHMAKTHGIKLIVPLTDGYEWYNGNYGHFNPPGVSKDAFWTNTTSRANFKRYISAYLNHYNPYNGCFVKDDPCIAMVELGNELGNIRPGANSNSIPTYEWLNDISGYVKSIDKNHLVLSPCDESFGKVGEQNITHIDVNTSHFYWNDKSKLEYAKTGGKPVLVGEVDSKADWIREYDSTCGALAWSMYPYDGYGNRIHHNDGYTFYDGDQYFLKWKEYCNRVYTVPVFVPPVVVPPVVVPPVVVPPVVVPPVVVPPVVLDKVVVAGKTEISITCSNCSFKNVCTL